VKCVNEQMLPTRSLILLFIDCWILTSIAQYCIFLVSMAVLWDVCVNVVMQLASVMAIWKTIMQDMVVCCCLCGLTFAMH